MSSELTSSTTVISTSDASPFVRGVERPLTDAEHALLGMLLEYGSSRSGLVDQLWAARVQSMNDGGMGSLRFAGPPGRTMREIVRAKSFDVDGIVLEMSLNLDQYGRLFEFDIWKVDFSPLIRFPEPAQVQIV